MFRSSPLDAALSISQSFTLFASFLSDSVSLCYLDAALAFGVAIVGPSLSFEDALSVFRSVVVCSVSPSLFGAGSALLAVVSVG